FLKFARILVGLASGAQDALNLADVQEAVVVILRFRDRFERAGELFERLLQAAGFHVRLGQEKSSSLTGLTARGRSGLPRAHRIGRATQVSITQTEPKPGEARFRRRRGLASRDALQGGNGVFPVRLVDVALRLQESSPSEYLGRGSGTDAAQDLASSL